MQMLVLSTAAPASGLAVYWVAVSALGRGARIAGTKIAACEGRLAHRSRVRRTIRSRDHVRFTHRITSIETVPPDPENARSDHDEPQVTRAMRGPIRGVSRTDTSRAHEPGRTGGNVDDIPSGIVDDAELEEEAAAPDRKGRDDIGERHPERHEHDPGEEVHAAQEGPGHDDDGDGAAGVSEWGAISKSWLTERGGRFGHG